MATRSPDELLEFLERAQLLGPSQFEALQRESDRYASAADLAEDLVQRGWLTPYQADQLCKGAGDHLVVGPYRLLEPLGEGGMGVVYRALQPKLSRVVALKLIRPQMLADRPEAVRRFQREATAIAQLMHPNIVVLYDAGESEGTHYLAMEYVEGITLERMVRLNGPLPVKQACDYIRQAALGLQHAHEMGLVHRDIKPGNLLVASRPTPKAMSSVLLRKPALVTPADRNRAARSGPDSAPPGAGNWGVVKVLDMGLARLHDTADGGPATAATPLTRTGALLGTPDYMAPEQGRNASTVDVRADLYSLGCTFYYLLTGSPPFPEGNGVQKVLMHQTQAPFPLLELRPHTPAPVVNVVQRLMEKRPENRYQTPAQLAEALAALTAPPLPPPPGLDAPPAIHRAPDSAALTPVPPARPSAANSEPQTSAMRGRATALVSVGGIVPAKKLVALPSHTGCVLALAFDPAGERFASGGVDGRVRVWELAGGAPREVARLGRDVGEVQSVAFHPQEPYLVIGSTHAAGRVFCWDWGEGRLAEWGQFPDETRGVEALAFSPDGRLLAASAGRQLSVWRVSARSAGGRTALKGHSHPVKGLAFAPDGRLLASVGAGKSVRVWEFGWLGAGQRDAAAGHADIITAVAYSPDGARLATGGLDRSVRLWDGRNPSKAEPVALPGQAHGVRAMRFLADGSRLMSVSEGGQVLLWDLATNAVVCEWYTDQRMNASAALSPDGRHLVIGSIDGRVSVYALDEP